MGGRQGAKRNKTNLEIRAQVSTVGLGTTFNEARSMLVECWLWRYRDPLSGELRTTKHPMDADEVAAFPNAKRIRGTKTYRFEDEESPETIPAVFRAPPEDG